MSHIETFCLAELAAVDLLEMVFDSSRDTLFIGMFEGDVEEKEYSQRRVR
jgi:hypothetical protein